jgi:cysteine-rich repeat protein
MRRATSILVLLWAAGCSDDSTVTPPPLDSGPKPEAKVGDGKAGDVPIKPGDGAADGALLFDCTGKPDGTDCSGGAKSLICLKGSCVASSCGDSYVDASAGEDCDDGNADPDDGCSSCKFGCKAAADCDDKNSCNGTEDCDTTAHKCKAGTPAADGTACGTGGVCNGGVCSTAGCGNGTKEGTEECDDGNKVDGDGCDNTCKFSCKADSDCDDKNKCTGTETCKKETGKQYCQPGTKLDCNDNKSCTSDLCMPSLGCLHVPIDADKDGKSCEDDCNDNDPSIFKGAPDCADGKDNDCDPKTPDGAAPGKCWPDKDGDSYGTASGMINNCVCPKGYTSRDPAGAGQADCWDYLSSVNPGQTAWFATAYCKGIGYPKCLGTTSFDYDCDGKEEQRWIGLASPACVKVYGGPGAFACIGAGWSTNIPACGFEAKYTECNKDSTGKYCLKSEILRKQECH